MAVPRTIKGRAGLMADWMKSAVRKDGRCCSPVPEVVLAFDQQGNVVKKMLPYFGGTQNGYEMLDFPHGVTIDYKGNVWVGNNTAEDSRILKFDQNGKFLLQIGTKGVRGFSNDTKNLGAAGGATVDPVTNEVYIADGSFNRRVIVFDADTGQYKRHWGAYGKKPDDTPFKFDPNGPPPQQFGNVHCAEISKDRLVYVCDWHNNRIQVFRPDGTFVKEGFIDKFSPYSTVWGMAISRDPQQRFLYVVDGNARKVHIIVRDTLEEVSSFGVPGAAAGQFMGDLHQIGSDSKGNLYVSEADHDLARIQRFLYKGLVPAIKDQGPAWPQRVAQTVKK
jgi:DNA-binding beta-propeller fold protein YncE